MLLRNQVVVALTAAMVEATVTVTEAAMAEVRTTNDGWRTQG
jgi:hypothetical protein